MKERGHVSSAACQLPCSKDRGRLLTTVLAGAWHKTPEPPKMTASELTDVVPLLLGSGAGGLGWWRIQHGPLATTDAGRELQQSYRFHTLYAAVHERALQTALAALEGAGVEALLIKGWAIARLYPQHGLRPYGDLDLLIRPEQESAACAALISVGMPLSRTAGKIDLKTELPSFYGLNLDELFERAHRVWLSKTLVQVPAPEDHLRILCLHFLKHGAWRPLWACDIAVLLQARGSDFDWTRCLGSEWRRADWIACAVGITHHQLGVPLDNAPPALSSRATHLPGWVVATVQREWQRPSQQRHLPPFALTMQTLRRWSDLPPALRQRWPNPIAVSLRTQMPFTSLYPWPLVLLNCSQRSIRFLWRSSFRCSWRHW